MSTFACLSKRCPAGHCPSWQPCPKNGGEQVHWPLPLAEVTAKPVRFFARLLFLASASSSQTPGQTRKHQEVHKKESTLTVIDFQYDLMVCDDHCSQKVAYGRFLNPPHASSAAGACQFIVARTGPAFALLTDVKIATEAAVWSFSASITRACRCALIADTRFAVRGRGLAKRHAGRIAPCLIL